ncbi:hypothetical protein ON010_g17583 [Phytophthora cinnamomi]|nr:hypothetical protein ON010_g17583 [Phytophthora cinnamomi]
MAHEGAWDPIGVSIRPNGGRNSVFEGKGYALRGANSIVRGGDEAGVGEVCGDGSENAGSAVRREGAGHDDGGHDALGARARGAAEVAAPSPKPPQADLPADDVLPRGGRERLGANAPAVQRDQYRIIRASASVLRTVCAAIDGGSRGVQDQAAGRRGCRGV